ncbi:MAG: hypothetical protein U0235_17590 [Polyangiaceae bacterium]
MRGVLIYTHACSVRVRFKVALSTVLGALPRCGWSEDPAPSIWKASKPGAALQRYVLRGSKWLDERPPSNRKLPLTELNREWRTRLYSLAIERKGDTFHVDLQVVRHGDIRRFMEEVLGLNSADWEIAYYRAVERYTTVSPHVALRLAEGIGALPTIGRGRQARKRWLVRDYPIPITVRTSAKATATLVVYRIERGATAHYRVEVRLRGKRQDRGQFDAADARRLDDVLLDLVKTFGLTTKPSPGRWEPRTFTTPIERGPFDGCIRRLPQKAWRGTRISEQLKRTVRGCHTPSLVKCVVGSGQGDSFRRPVRIRRSISSSGPPPSAMNEWKRVEGEGFEVARYVPEDQEGLPAEEERSLQRDPYASTAEDIARSGLYIHEVILDADEDPRRLLEALAAGPLGTVGVAALCAVDRAGQADTWLSVIEATNEYPVEAEGIETMLRPPLRSVPHARTQSPTLSTRTAPTPVRLRRYRRRPQPSRRGWPSRSSSGRHGRNPQGHGGVAGGHARRTPSARGTEGDAHRPDHV